ncbi:PREDICTED: intercellular adhesion molecule 2 isoform X5 [Rhinopithecus bieti]|uniref:intercellular adhesion molecule 2 isoform X5 n=1 Tax=Rhinopithecus bieti TaxID=61621 RepID=UPI00083BFF06|nr:PREDICTED: intercellular adhesion molecule 2 isoform X5 [Rhinopithecus bieti]
MQSSVCRRLGILGRGQTCALTCALRLPPGSPWLVPARPWTPPEMSSFGFGTLTVALFALVCCSEPPKQVFLTLQPTWVAVGKSFTIECRVPAVEPLDRLTLFLLRGNETLHSQTFGKAAPALQEATATFSSTAHREDGHHNFSCLAELNLTSRGGDVFQKHSAPKMLEIYEPVPDSQMVIIVLVVSVLLFLFVTSVLLCFIFSQHWRQRRTGTYGVRAAWRRLPQAFRP